MSSGWIHWVLFTGLVSMGLPLNAVAQADPREIREGHWVEVRGQLDEAGVFQAARVEIVHQQRYEVLIGTAEASDRDNHIRVLGREVELVDKTDFQKFDRTTLPGSRVKVEGYFRGVEMFSAREVSNRGKGRERIVGRADRVRRDDNAVWLDVMGFTVTVPTMLELDHEDPLGEYVLSQRRTQPFSRESRNEDDQFGKGIRISENLLFAGLAEARWTGEDEFDLDQRDPEDRQDSESSFRGRLIYRPSVGFVGVLELSHRRLWRQDDEDGRIERDATVLGETFGYWFDPLGLGADLQLGRIDFDEEREWLYDQNLDGFRVFANWYELASEFSVTTTLSDGSPFDEDTVNYMIYVSNGNEDEHLAAYIIRRDTDFGAGLDRTHFGIRAHGEFRDDFYGWLELAYMYGDEAGNTTSGWGLDVGSTWSLDSGFNFTAAYALGQGDKPDSTRNNAFRQTGLQDNNARFAGVTSFRYYGELTDPELTNLEIYTAGIGYRFQRKISLDLVGHYYRQDELSNRWRESEIDSRPNGRSKDLGWEADLILGWRTNPSFDVEVVAAWFDPGNAFNNADRALLGKVQLRFRF
ncbi:MAG TPA: alginate export family protein [Xanthomonadales bacterium]|nr:alginate export family protein [Xanthomonadales bacterium]